MWQTNKCNKQAYIAVEVPRKCGNIWRLKVPLQKYNVITEVIKALTLQRNNFLMSECTRVPRMRKCFSSSNSCICEANNHRWADKYLIQGQGLVGNPVPRNRPWLPGGWKAGKPGWASHQLPKCPHPRVGLTITKSEAKTPSTHPP